MTVPTIACLLLGGAISDRLRPAADHALFRSRRAGSPSALLAALALAHALTFATCWWRSSRSTGSAPRSSHRRSSRSCRRSSPPSRLAAGKRARPVRPADRPSPRRACRSAACSSGRSEQARRSRWTPAPSWSRRAPSSRMRPTAVSEPAPISTVVAVADGLRFVRRQRAGCGAPCSPRRSRTSSSSGRPKCCSVSSSRTSCMARRPTSDSCSQRAASARSAPRS